MELGGSEFWEDSQEVCLQGDRLVAGENGDETGREMGVEEKRFQKRDFGKMMDGRGVVG